MSNEGECLLSKAVCYRIIEPWPEQENSKFPMLIWRPWAAAGEGEVFSLPQGQASEPRQGIPRA